MYESKNVTSRPEDMRWSSHCKTISRLITIDPSVMEVLKYVEETSVYLPSAKQAGDFKRRCKNTSLYFTHTDVANFRHHTHIVLISLKKNQDLLNASSLISSTKRQLEKFRIEGFN